MAEATEGRTGCPAVTRARSQLTSGMGHVVSGDAFEGQGWSILDSNSGTARVRSLLPGCSEHFGLRSHGIKSVNEGYPGLPCTTQGACAVRPESRRDQRHSCPLARVSTSSCGASRISLLSWLRTNYLLFWCCRIRFQLDY